MEINKDNYEAYLLDLAEGRLSAEEKQKVRDFLLLNPDCSVEISQADPWILGRNKIIFPGKEQLKKQLPDPSFMLTESNFDLFSIARLEGDLTEKQVKDHKSMVQGNEKKRMEWTVWQNTRLKADPVIFIDKDRLKRKKGLSKRMIWVSVISTAAAIALLVTLFRTDPPTPALEIVEKTIQKEEPVPQKTTNKQNIALVNPQKEPEAGENKPVLFSIKKNPEREEASEERTERKDSAPGSDSVSMANEQEVRPGPVRIAGISSGKGDLVNRGVYDHIEPLVLPGSSIHLRSLSMVQLSEIDLQEIFDDYTKENELSLWTIANAGFKGINRITGSNISLLAARDDNGDVQGFRFTSRRFSFATPLDREE